jgi:pyruvate dehydrogenase E2 component (dihydrolipoamide acetyltransferase)
VSVIEAIEIMMPRLSDSMEEGTIVRWLKASGETVEPGDAVVEIETDKATMEYEVEAGGVLEVLAEEGATVPLGSPIGRLLPEGETPEPYSPESSGRGVEESDQSLERPGDEPRPPAARTTGGQRILATPVARRIASELGIELGEVKASGRRGQIVKADVEAIAQLRHERNGAAELSATEPSPDKSSAPEGTRRQELTRVQRTIARRMSESRAVVPDFTLEVEIDMGACLALRAQLAEHADPAPSINDMIVKACARALRRHPRANGAYREDGFDLFTRINVGIAVATDDALLVPVVADADQKSLTEIATATRSLASRARDGEITPAELSGATFTVSNLGMFGITRFTAIIDTPQAAILAVGAVQDTPIVTDGRVEAAKMMTATLASDHRILYGSDAAIFLTEIRNHLQAPISLVV